MQIRDAHDDDWPGIWPLVRETAAEGDAYTYPPDLSEEDARATWLGDRTWSTIVAVDDQTVLGVAAWGPNHPGPGSHVSNGSFLVASAARGRGVGTALFEETLARARADGYAGMQFNAVVETNPAVPMYQRHGFEIIGTVPGAFRHPTHGFVGLHVMYLAF